MWEQLKGATVPSRIFDDCHYSSRELQFKEFLMTVISYVKDNSHYILSKKWGGGGGGGGGNAPFLKNAPPPPIPMQVIALQGGGCV